MDKEQAELLIARLNDLRMQRNLSNRQLGDALAIPAGTVQKWFAQGSSRRLPSGGNLRAIQAFLVGHGEAENTQEQTWKRLLEWWHTQHRYSSASELAVEIGWDADTLARHITTGTIPPRIVVDAIASKAGAVTASNLGVTRAAKERATRVRYLLLLLEEELRAFRDGSRAEREVLRSDLDFTDVGYISSLLTMLAEEDKFERWLALTGKRFGFLRKRGTANEKDPD